MMPSSSQQGTSSSLSSQLSGQLSRPPLSKASTQLQLLSDRSSAAARLSSSDTSPNTKGSHWIPDYTLRASSDTTYLKVRKNTYLVAVKASRMENSANYPAWREEELDEVLVKITENDADFCSTRSRQGLRSPESRRDSVWSTISIIKSKLGGKSNNSFENIREERFWEILGNNNNEEKTEATSTPHIDSEQ